MTKAAFTLTLWGHHHFKKKKKKGSIPKSNIALHVFHVIQMVLCEQWSASFMSHRGNIQRGLAAVNIVNRMRECQWGRGEGGRAGVREKLGRVRKETLDLSLQRSVYNTAQSECRLHECPSHKQDFCSLLY